MSRRERGAISIFMFMVMATMVSVVAAYLGLEAVKAKAAADEIDRSRAFWIAEAGLQQAIWLLKTPPGSGGQGDSWTTTGTSQNFSGGNYNMVVAARDFGLAANGSEAQASSVQGTQAAGLAIDNSTLTFWESSAAPTNGNPQWIQVEFPKPTHLSRFRFVVPAGSNSNRPRNYDLQISSDGNTFTTLSSVNNNTNNDVTHTFTIRRDVRFVRLRVTRAQQNSGHVRIATLEAMGRRITSTGTWGGISRIVRQSIVARQNNQTAAAQTDWLEPGS